MINANDIDSNCHITQNNHGVMHGVTSILKSFIDYSNICKGVVLDIGAAYGIAVIPVLTSNTNVQVIACDISATHLNDLSAKVKEIEGRDKIELSHRLSLINARFPEFELEENSLDAVLASHVLAFLSGKEIERGVKQLFTYLKPGGKLFVLSYTIYNNLMRDYISIYEKRKQLGDKWPGEIDDASVFWDKNNPLSKVLPIKLNHLEPLLVRPILEQAGFVIEFLDFVPTENNVLDALKYKGNEAMGFIARKPIPIFTFF